MIIVGLGNPGKEYEKTPHNVGFMCVDEIAKKHQIEFKLSKKHQALIGEGMIENQKCVLIKPVTYMNLSGYAVESYIHYYNFNIEDIVVIYDDMDLPLGNIRIRKSGSAGGHRGMKSVIEYLKTNEIKRIRIGISHPDNRSEVIDFVLHHLNKTEEDALNKSIHKIPEIVEDALNSGFDKMMNKFNGSK